MAGAITPPHTLLLHRFFFFILLIRLLIRHFLFRIIDALLRFSPSSLMLLIAAAFISPPSFFRQLSPLRHYAALPAEQRHNASCYASHDAADIAIRAPRCHAFFFSIDDAAFRATQGT